MFTVTMVDFCQRFSSMCNFAKSRQNILLIWSIILVITMIKLAIIKASKVDFTDITSNHFSGCRTSLILCSLQWLLSKYDKNFVFGMKINQPWIILFMNKASIFTFTVHNIRAQGKQACSRQWWFFWKKRTFTAKASTEFIIQIDWPHCPLTKAGEQYIPPGDSFDEEIRELFPRGNVSYVYKNPATYYIYYYYSNRAIGRSKNLEGMSIEN